jgi:hypothetical protein
MTEQTRVAFVGEDIEEVTTTLKANSDFEWKLLASNKN